MHRPQQQRGVPRTDSTRSSSAAAVIAAIGIGVTTVDGAAAVATHEMETNTTAATNTTSATEVDDHDSYRRTRQRRMTIGPDYARRRAAAVATPTHGYSTPTSDVTSTMTNHHPVHHRHQQQQSSNSSSDMVAAREEDEQRLQQIIDEKNHNKGAHHSIHHDLLRNKLVNLKYKTIQKMEADNWMYDIPRS